jgi:hypothetical protein
MQFPPPPPFHFNRVCTNVHTNRNVLHTPTNKAESTGYRIHFICSLSNVFNRRETKSDSPQTILFAEGHHPHNDLGYSFALCGTPTQVLERFGAPGVIRKVRHIRWIHRAHLLGMNTLEDYVWWIREIWAIILVTCTLRQVITSQ